MCRERERERECTRRARKLPVFMQVFVPTSARSRDSESVTPSGTKAGYVDCCPENTLLLMHLSLRLGRDAVAGTRGSHLLLLATAPNL